MKTILGIETSCDETTAAIAVKQDRQIKIIANVTASSAPMQAKYGGVIPEQAAREQLKAIIPVLTEVLHDAKLVINEIDAIAVAQGPGLIGSLLIGVETAKVLSLAWNKPLIPINHLLGHFYANWINEPEHPSPAPTFPIIGLLVSGGHSDIVLFKDHNQYEYLGGTRDDAAGECFDKSARLLGLTAVQGGPMVAKYALEGNSKAYTLPRPLSGSDDFDYSFAGLKTSILNTVESLSRKSTSSISKRDKLYTVHDPQVLRDLCASLQEAIVDTLIKKVIKAAQTKAIDQIMLAGGVAANARLREKLQEKFHGQILAPLPKYCTDNAAMIAAAGFFSQPLLNTLDLQANPNLSLSLRAS